MADAMNLPTGVVTFLLTDVEASTRLWRESSDAAAAMQRHATLIADAASGDSRQSRVEASTSVRGNVTTPVGRFIASAICRGP